MEKFQITYELGNSPPTIKCLVCNMVSYNSNDIARLYCGHCHAFHNIMTDKHGKPISLDRKPLNQI
jgi:hypothetical protein